MLMVYSVYSVDLLIAVLQSTSTSHTSNNSIALLTEYTMLY